MRWPPKRSSHARALGVWRSAGFIILSTLSVSPPVWGQANNAPKETLSPVTIQVYASADESSEPVGTLLPDEPVKPLAESQGTGGVKWYLVKTQTGIVGWIKQSDSEHSKKVDSFFKALPRETASTTVTIPNISSAAAPQGAIIVPILSSGRSTLVSVTLNRTITGNLMLDTGATNTVISRRLAGLLSLRPQGRATFQTVGGMIAVAVTRLQSLKVAEAEVNDLAVVVHDFSRDPRIEGLLGMDFLGRYRIGLDIQKQVLVLAPR